MRVSVTERQTYKRCRRKWEYSSYNRQSLSPIINAPALDLGTIIHAVLAAWTDEPTDDPILLYNSIATTHLQQVIASYTQRIGCAPSEVELTPLLEAISLGQHMIANYQKKWRSPLPAGYTLIQNELSLIQPVPGTEHCTQWHDGCRCAQCGPALTDTCCTHCCLGFHELECTFDGVMADANGDLYIIERKTFSRTPNVDELNQNDQFLAYQWALNQQMPGKVVGVAYDGLLKKAAPSGVHKDLDSLFLRRLLLRPQAELDEFGTLLALELLEMANPSLPIYKTVPFMGCQKWECSYMQVCQATSKGEPVDDLLKMFVKTDRKKHLDVES